MSVTEEIHFDKYQARGNRNWEEMITRNPRAFNAYQQARYGWILRVAGLVEGKKVLDVGCGGGSLTYLLAKAGAEVIGVENEELGLTFANRNLSSVDAEKKLHWSFSNASAYDLPFGDAQFDLVVSCEVIEHLQDPEKMLAEIARVLKKGGKAIITTPLKLTEFPKDPNHVQEFYPEQLGTMLKKYFEGVEVQQTHHMLWRSLYTHRFFGRPLGKWCINTLALVFGWNPFMIEYPHPTKFDIFSTILVSGVKK